MTDRERIEARIAELRGELARAEGRPTEVYSRIVGYYRPVRNWNAGKRAEYAERRAFAMPEGRAPATAAAASAAAPAPAATPVPARVPKAVPARAAAAEASLFEPAADCLVFTREACPNCPPVANYVVGAGIRATFVDVDRAEGLELAREHGVLSTPTVLGLDGQGHELFRALDVNQLRTKLAAARA